jgi:hypothetical protein
LFQQSFAAKYLQRRFAGDVLVVDVQHAHQLVAQDLVAGALDAALVAM